VTAPILSVRKMCAGYDNVPVVHDLDLEVPAGGFVAIVGSNGAGKSTTMRAVMGLAQVTSGAVEIDGVPITGLRTSERVRLGVALCPEGRSVFPTLTVEENLRTGSLAGRRWQHRSADVERVYEILPRLGERRGQQAGTLSGGEQQQLALGRALTSAPRLLLVDEASLGLAPVIVDLVFDLLHDINEAGTAIVAVEQNIGIANVAKEIAVLEDGAITSLDQIDGFGDGLRRSARDAYFGTGGSDD